MTGFETLKVEGTPSLTRVFEDAAKRVYIGNQTIHEKWNPKKVHQKKKIKKIKNLEKFKKLKIILQLLIIDKNKMNMTNILFNGLYVTFSLSLLLTILLLEVLLNFFVRVILFLIDIKQKVRLIS